MLKYNCVSLAQKETWSLSLKMFEVYGFAFVLHICPFM